MPYFYSKGVRIVGISGVVPETCIENRLMTHMLSEKTVRKFIRYTGIKKRHIARAQQTASDLGYVAADKLLSDMQIDRTQVGALIFCSQEADYIKPATAHVLQKRLGLFSDCAVFDINLGCSGFVYCNQIMETILSASDAQYGLLILGNTPNKSINPLDRSISLMFGDAGSSILYEKSGQGKNCTLLRADGERYSSIMIPSGGFRDPCPKERFYIANDGLLHSKYNLYMDGLDVFTFFITDVVDTIKEYLRHKQKEIEDFDYVVLHQANITMLKHISAKLNIPFEKMLISLDEYGNTSSTSIPLTIAKNLCGKNWKEMHILVAGFGIGLSWGVTEMTLENCHILPIIESDQYYKEGIVS